MEKKSYKYKYTYSPEAEDEPKLKPAGSNPVTIKTRQSLNNAKAHETITLTDKYHTQNERNTSPISGLYETFDGLGLIRRERERERKLRVLSLEGLGY